MKQQVQSPAGGFVSHANICIWWAEVVEFSLIGTKRQLGGSSRGSKYIYFVPQQHQHLTCISSQLKSDPSFNL